MLKRHDRKKRGCNVRVGSVGNPILNIRHHLVSKKKLRFQPEIVKSVNDVTIYLEIPDDNAQNLTQIIKNLTPEW
jgi:hypothetical protein